MDLVLGQLLSAVLLFILSVIFTIIFPVCILKPKKDYSQLHNTVYEIDEQNGLRENANLITGGEAVSNEQDLVFLLAGEPLVAAPPDNIFKKIFKGLMKYNLISAINCFCGGLFLGICMLDMVPSAQADVSNVLDKAGLEADYPFAEFVIAISLQMVIFLETMMTSCCQVDAHGNHQRARAGSAGSTSEEIRMTEQRTTEATRALVLIGTLVMHSVFEGMALGLASNLASTLQLLLVLSLHKCPFGFGVGMRVFETIGVRRRVLAVLLCMLFCAASPIGCIVGIVLSQGAQTSNPSTQQTPLLLATTSAAPPTSQLTPMIALEAFFSCLVAGTFLYITFVEVIPGEFSHSHDPHPPPLEHNPTTTESSTDFPPGVKRPIPKFMKLLLLFFGFTITSFLQLMS